MKNQDEDFMAACNWLDQMDEQNLVAYVVRYSDDTYALCRGIDGAKTPRLPECTDAVYEALITFGRVYDIDELPPKAWQKEERAAA